MSMVFEYDVFLSNYSRYKNIVLGLAELPSSE